MPNIDRAAVGQGRGRATRLKITTAAAELVAELGWDAVTTRAVAARAGVNQALIHYHFESMDALLREAVVAALEETMAEAAGPLAHGSLAEALTGTVAAIEHIDPRSPAAILLAESLVRAVRDPRLAEPIVAGLREFRRMLADRVARAVADGDAPADLPPAAFSTFLAASLDGLLLHRIVDPDLDVAGALDILLRLVVVPAPARPGGPS